MHATNSQVRLQHLPLLISKEGVRGKIWGNNFAFSTVGEGWDGECYF